MPDNDSAGRPPQELAAVVEFLMSVNEQEGVTMLQGYMSYTCCFDFQPRNFVTLVTLQPCNFYASPTQSS